MPHLYCFAFKDSTCQPVVADDILSNWTSLIFNTHSRLKNISINSADERQKTEIEKIKLDVEQMQIAFQSIQDNVAKQLAEMKEAHTKECQELTAIISEQQTELQHYKSQQQSHESRIAILEEYHKPLVNRRNYSSTKLNEKQLEERKIERLRRVNPDKEGIFESSHKKRDSGISITSIKSFDEA